MKIQDSDFSAILLPQTKESIKINEKFIKTCKNNPKEIICISFCCSIEEMGKLFVL